MRWCFVVKVFLFQYKWLRKHKKTSIKILLHIMSFELHVFIIHGTLFCLEGMGGHHILISKPECMRECWNRVKIGRWLTDGLCKIFSVIFVLKKVVALLYIYKFLITFKYNKQKKSNIMCLFFLVKKTPQTLFWRGLQFVLELIAAFSSGIHHLLKKQRF